MHPLLGSRLGLLALGFTLRGQFAEGAEPEATDGACAHTRVAHAACMYRRSSLPQALSRAELVCAQLVELVQLQVACFVA